MIMDRVHCEGHSRGCQMLLQIGHLLRYLLHLGPTTPGYCLFLEIFPFIAASNYSCRIVGSSVLV